VRMIARNTSSWRALMGDSLSLVPVSLVPVSGVPVSGHQTMPFVYDVLKHGYWTVHYRAYRIRV